MGSRFQPDADAAALVDAGSALRLRSQ